MNSFINQFLVILSDNEYISNCREIPEEMDNRDEFIANLQESLDEGGHLPDSLRFFELNGKNSANELKEFLEKSFQSFKNDYLAGQHVTDELLNKELINQINNIISEFKQTVSEAMQLNDSDLIELYETKFYYFEKVLDFLNLKPVKGGHNKQKTTKKTVYYFTVQKEFAEKFKYNYYLNHLYEGLKDELGYIDCTLLEFNNLFCPIGKTKRKTPEPIIWTSGAYSHLAYFIQCLVKVGFIPNSRQPSFNQIAKKLFFDNLHGEYFEGESLKSDLKNRNKSPYLEINNMIQSRLKKNQPTIR